MTTRRYGWLRGHHDQRDHVYRAKRAAILPERVDLRDVMPGVYDQGSQGSCVAHGCAALAEHLLRAYEQEADQPTSFQPSRSHIYYEARARRGWQASDTGAYVRDGLKVMAQEGVVPESEFEYNEHVWDREPSDAIEAIALCTRIAPYAAVQQYPTAVMQALADGHPVVFGCTVYESFESEAVARDGGVGMPMPGEYPLGGHCMVIVGYDRQLARFYVRNSWGPKWAIGGHCSMPFEYICNHGLSSDLFVATGVLT